MLLIYSMKLSAGSKPFPVNLHQRKEAIRTQRGQLFSISSMKNGIPKRFFRCINWNRFSSEISKQKSENERWTFAVLRKQTLNFLYNTNKHCIGWQIIANHYAGNIHRNRNFYFAYRHIRQCRYIFYWNYKHK